jgi:hypothetical protein
MDRRMGRSAERDGATGRGNITESLRKKNDNEYSVMWVSTRKRWRKLYSNVKYQDELERKKND